jgi:hypothetical protein
MNLAKLAAIEQEVATAEGPPQRTKNEAEPRLTGWLYRKAQIGYGFPIPQGDHPDGTLLTLELLRENTSHEPRYSGNSAHAGPQGIGPEKDPTRTSRRVRSSLTAVLVDNRFGH